MTVDPNGGVGMAKTERVTVRFSEAQFEQIERIAHEMGLSVSDVVRLCVRDGLPQLAEKFGVDLEG
jgi:antitoxin component of RelBE/YafQ-DinJ toxin-antitoxin module